VISRNLLETESGKRFGDKRGALGFVVRWSRDGGNRSRERRDGLDESGRHGRRPGDEI
jgi:hypothetical protein